MDWTQPIQLNFENKPTALERLALLIGHYDNRVYLTDRAYLDVGAGSLGAFARIAKLDTDYVGCIGYVGRYCEINESAEILAGGSHNHDLPVNMSLTVMASLSKNPSGGMLPTKPVSIGSGVVISSGAKIMPGVAIGDGAVVGAMTLVTKPVGAYEIVGGVPARTIRQRQSAQPWWDFSADYLLANMADIQRVATDSGPHRWRSPAPRFVIRWRKDGLEFLGFAPAEETLPISQAPSRVQDYIVQAITSDNPYWLADCWT